MSNRPLIVGLLFLGTYFAPFLILIGLPLAYVFQRRPEEEWEQSHFQYLIRTFWLALAILIVAGFLAIGIAYSSYVIEGGWHDEAVPVVIWLVLAIGAGGLALAYSGIRIIISLMKSAIRTPITNPKALFF